MTMPYTVMVARQDVQSHVQRIVSDVFQSANDVLNGWNEHSEISRLNACKPGKAMPISNQLSALFTVVDDMHTLSDGRFDPTTGVLTALFENCITDRQRPPLPGELAPYRFAVGWTRRLERNDRDHSVARGNAHTIVDLDGLSKGFVIDRIVQALHDGGYEDCYVDWAGDIRACGRHPSGRPWRAAVVRPPPLKRLFQHWKNANMKDMLSESDIGYVADVSDSAIATSGDYFAMQKYGYHHIAVPSELTVMKANGKSVGSVCIVAKTCVTADAMATAAMTFGNLEETVAFVDGLLKAERVIGYCVMGRANDGDDATVPVTVGGAMFEALSLGQAAAQDARDTTVSSSDGDTILANTLQQYGSVEFQQRQIEVNSIVACSMQPYQILTFVVPLAFVKGASLNDEEEHNKLSCRIYTSAPNSATRKQGAVAVNLSFVHIFEHGHTAIVAARVDSIDLGSVQTSEIVFKDTVLATMRFELKVARSKFGFQPLVQQTKTMLRQIASMVWLVSTTSADGSRLALTGTSVVVPDAAKTMVYLNITHSSAFFAAFGGVDSELRLYALSSEQHAVAARHVNESMLNQHAVHSLDDKSMLAMDACVDFVENVQDHILVAARITRLDLPASAPAKPLVWYNAAFYNYAQ